MREMSTRKKKLIIAGAAVLMLALPIIVLAAIYNSAERKNSFSPAEANIRVYEPDGENKLGDVLENEFIISKDDKSTVKKVKINNEALKNDELLKVMFVPMWVEKETGNVCAVLDETGSCELCSQKVERDELLCRNKAGGTVLTLTLAEGWDEKWDTDTLEGMVVFRYKGAFKADHYTDELITKVTFSDAAYAQTESLDLKLEVLADAIQTSGGASSARDW